jgi:ABC-type branched-subunit amino acid transport system substrate-binding protein
VGAPALIGEEITLYHFCAQSGPFADFNQSRILAARDMVAYINEEGGVFGARIDMQLVDTAGDPETALAAYNRIRSLDNNVLLILICDAQTEIALAEQLVLDKVSALGPGLAAPAYYEGNNSHLYSFNVRADQQFAAWLDYLMQHWQEIKPLGEGDQIRLTLINWPQGQGGIVDTAAALAYAAELGVEIGSHNVLSASSLANLSDPIYAARDANSNAIYIQARGSASAELLNAINALGLRERMLIAGPSYAFETSLLPNLFDPAFANGSYLTLSTPWWSEQDSLAIQLASEIFDENGHSEEMKDAAYLSMLGAVDIVRRALEDAILAAEFNNLDANALQSALASLSDYGVLDDLYLLDYASGSHSLNDLQLFSFTEDPSQLIRLHDIEEVPHLEIDIAE